MDYGPSLMDTYEVGGPGPNFAYKGIAVRLDTGPGGVSRGRHWVLFDHDTLRFAAAWSGDGFIDWNGINFNGQHQVHPKLVGERRTFANPVGPGWADPETGRFDDPRPSGRDGKPYGPLPRVVGAVQGDVPLRRPDGHLVHRRRRDDPGNAGATKLTRRRQGRLHAHAERRQVVARPARPRRPGRGRPSPWSATSAVSLAKQDGFHVLTIPAAATPTRVKVLMAKGDADALTAFAKTSPAAAAAEAAHQGRAEALAGGAEDDRRSSARTTARSPSTCSTLPGRATRGTAQLRLTGFDFYAGRQADGRLHLGRRRVAGRRASTTRRRADLAADRLRACSSRSG